METNFKYVPYRNKKILQFAKGQSCQHCGLNNGTSVMAHSNAMRHGKAVGKKSDDCYVAILCSECHDNYDRKLNSKYDDYRGREIKQRLLAQEDFDKAMEKTWRLLLINGVIK